MKRRRNVTTKNSSFLLLISVAFTLGWLSGCSLHPQASADAAFEHEIQGENYFHQGKFSAALQEYRTAIQIEPNAWPAHYKAGIVLEQQGSLQEAIAGYRKVIAIDYPVKNPADKAWWHSRLAGVLSKAGLHQQAIAEYKLTYKIASQDQTHSTRLAFLAKESLRLSDTRLK